MNHLINKKHRLKFVTFFLIAIIALGCNEWLDVEPENDLIKQEFWNTKEDVESCLAAAYSALRGSVMKTFIYGELRADMVIVNAGASFGDYARIAENDITSTNGAVKWTEYYKAINLANTVMYYAPIVKDKDKTFTQKLKNTMDSEMLFIRSLCYFYLVRLWKDVPLVLSPSVSDTVDIYIPKTSEHIILDHIVNDLKRASSIALTTEYIHQPTFYKGRANKYAIQALLADVLLWSERYDEAILYCDSIINTGLFDLESNSDWFNLYYPGNSKIESLFEIQFDDNLESQENPIYTDLINELNVTSRLIGLFEETDIRFSGDYGPFQKLVGLNATSSDRNNNQRDVNYIYYRYADILFIKAEALAELGNFEDANYLVRQVAERAGDVHVTALTYDGFMNTLMNERAREFTFEGKRWFDLLRWAKKDKFSNKKIIMDVVLLRATNAQMRAILKSKITDTLSYYLPIHEDELLYNTQLEQNSYYDR
ncbi:RagB/SusD family nutrient uptake outer membrane protein [Bacteroidota bacterium]